MRWTRRLRRSYSERTSPNEATYPTKAGRVLGSARLSPGALRYLLSNRTYLGEVRHRETWFPGLHAPIIDAGTFEAAAKLLASTTAQRVSKAKASGAPLRGLVFDDAGVAMSPSYAQGRDGTRHHYYVSQALKRPDGRRAGSRQRVHAGWLESQVMAIAMRVFEIAGGWEVLRSRLLRVLVAKADITIEIGPNDLSFELCHARLGLNERLDFEEDRVRLTFPIDPRFWRGAYQTFDENGLRLFKGEPDKALLRAIAKAHVWRRKWTAGLTLAAVAEEEGVDLSNLLRTIRIAYLAPDIVRTLAAGRSGIAQGVRGLVQRDLPLAWDEQRRMLFGDPSGRGFPN